MPVSPESSRSIKTFSYPTGVESDREALSGSGVQPAIQEQTTDAAISVLGRHEEQTEIPVIIDSIEGTLNCPKEP